jgi:hypothetical protein
MRLPYDGDPKLLQPGAYKLNSHSKKIVTVWIFVFHCRVTFNVFRTQVGPITVTVRSKA